MFYTLITMLVVLTLFYLILPQDAYAYLDPGTLSYLLSLLVAALVGGLFAVKQFWKKIRIFFKNLFCRTRKDE